MPADTPRRYQGEIVEWNDEKRCGFILPRGSKTPGNVVFLPAKSLKNRTRKPAIGDVVTYETVILENSPKNRHLRSRTRAENACFLGEDPPIPRAKSYRPPTLAAALYLLLLIAAAPFMKAALWLSISSLAFSTLSFVQYASDKSAAQNGKRRIPESGLQLTALLGGWPGAALAQSVFRHKTQKQSFQTVFRCMLALNLASTAAIIAWLTTRQAPGV